MPRVPDDLDKLRTFSASFRARPEFQHPAEFALLVATRLYLAEQRAGDEPGDPLDRSLPLGAALAGLYRVAGVPLPLDLAAWARRQPPAE